MLASLRRILLALFILWLLSQVVGWFLMRRAHNEVQAYEKSREAQGRAVEEEAKRPPPENEEFHQGRDEILRLRSSHWRDCPFKQGDGYRGCSKAFEQVRGEQSDDGKAWAKANKPAHAYDCQGDTWFQLGCRAVYREDFAPGGLEFPDLPLTTGSADCFKELRAYEALDDAYHDAIGMPQAAASHRMRSGPQYRNDCEMRHRREQAALKAAEAP
jgi:hypothetical protein